MSDNQQAEIERLRAENERLKKTTQAKLAMKVSEKGALSVYGMGRFPVTLLQRSMAEDFSRWLRDIWAPLIEANNDNLKSKE